MHRSQTKNLFALLVVLAVIATIVNACGSDRVVRPEKGLAVYRHAYEGEWGDPYPIDPIEVNVCQYGGTYPDCNEDPWGPCGLSPCGGEDPPDPCEVDYYAYGCPGYEPPEEPPAPPPNEPAVDLSCPTSVARGAEDNCTVSGAPSGSTYAWSFSSSVRSNTGTGNPWGGRWVTSGSVSVTVTTPAGRTYPLSASVTVTPRTNFRWAPAVTSSGSLGGQCFDTWAGLNTRFGGRAAQANCADAALLPNDVSGVSYGQGTGPNANVFYVAWHAYHVELYSGIHPQLRPGGPVQTVYNPNGACHGSQISIYGFNHMCYSTPAYDTYTAGLLAHEDHHVQLALDGATASNNNLPEQLEALLFTSEQALAAEVRRLRDEVNERIWNQVISIDNPYVVIWSGDVWLYLPNTGRFTLTGVNYPQ